MRLRLRLKLRLRLRARAKVRVRVRVGVRFRVRVRVRVGLRDLVPVDLDVACALQAGEPHEEAAHGEGAGPADALEGIPGAEAGERAEGHRACAWRDQVRGERRSRRGVQPKCSRGRRPSHAEYCARGAAVARLSPYRRRLPCTAA